ncbi:MAG: nitronate monooxygenase [Bacteroidia bacterium]|nr:nitronate monooxygenase [Bacteroidia bacterium]
MTINDLKSRLKIPVIVSPMFLVSGTKLVIECCKNGVLGTFPSLNGRTEDDFEAMLKEITHELEVYEKETQTKPAPFGVNLIVNKTNNRLQTDLALCVKYKVPLVITSLGAVKDVVDTIHSYGGLVFHDVIKKRHAQKALEAGVDGLIAVCAGAGGHAGTANPFAFSAEILSLSPQCMVLAGSINSGKDIVAAQTLGADFAYMGTRFIATHESLANQDYKNCLIHSTLEDIIYTDVVSGVNANFLEKSIKANQVDLSLHSKEKLEQKLISNEAKAWKDIWSAGHGVSNIHQILSVKNLIDLLHKEYIQSLKEQMDRLNKIVN